MRQYDRTNLWTSTDRSKSLFIPAGLCGGVTFPQLMQHIEPTDSYCWHERLRRDPDSRHSVIVSRFRS
jgi:hypothetical protein